MRRSVSVLRQLHRTAAIVDEQWGHNTGWLSWGRLQGLGAPAVAESATRGSARRRLRSGRRGSRCCNRPTLCAVHLCCCSRRSASLCRCHVAVVVLTVAAGVTSRVVANACCRRRRVACRVIMPWTGGVSSRSVAAAIRLLPSVAAAIRLLLGWSYCRWSSADVRSCCRSPLCRRRSQCRTSEKVPLPRGSVLRRSSHH